MSSEGRSSRRAARAARFASLTPEEKAQTIADVTGRSVWITEDEVLLTKPERGGIVMGRGF